MSSPQISVYHEQYWLTNLLLADGIAKRNGLHRAGAVRKCARRMRSEAKTERLYTLAGLIIKASDKKVVGMATGLFDEMKKDGLIYADD